VSQPPGFESVEFPPLSAQPEDGIVWAETSSQGMVSEGPIWRTRERGSKWEPIKILLEGDGNSNKMNAASNTLLQLTTQVSQAHVATGPRNQHTTFRPENAAEHQTSSLQTNTDQTGEHHQSDRSLLVKPSNFHQVAPHQSDR
jgi:Tfp pilus assembly protein FimT